MKIRILVLVLFLMIPATVFAQTKSAVGTFVSTESGTGSGSVCLRIRGNIKCFDWYSSTKFQGFRNGKGWETGAEWRITFYYKKNYNVPILRSATFTGRIIK